MARQILLVILASCALSAAEQPRDMKAYYQRSCAACHGADGSGRSGTGARLSGRSLADARWQARKTDGELVKSILNGKSAMPAFGSQLKEEEALKLLTDVIRPMAAKKK